jgi:hypothetical protein
VMTRKRTAGSVAFLTAIGVMRLVEIGKVDLDADVNQYLKLLRPHHGGRSLAQFTSGDETVAEILKQMVGDSETGKPAPFCSRDCKGRDGSEFAAFSAISFLPQTAGRSGGRSCSASIAGAARRRPRESSGRE